MTRIAFDRAAASYDMVRAHPPEVASQIGRALAELCGDGALVLELGVGTGRIALPATAAGLRVVGVDLSAEMLRVARRGSHELHELAGQPERDTAVADVRGVRDRGRGSHELHELHELRGRLEPRTAPGDVRGVRDRGRGSHELHELHELRGRPEPRTAPGDVRGARGPGVEIHGEHGEHRGLARDAHGATIRAIRAIRGPLFLIHGDITALPLANESFDATLAVHVLHLVADWRGALSEALRVTQTGGLFILGRDWRDPNSAGVKLRGKLREAVMELLPGIKPPAAGAAIPQALAKLGAEPQGETTAATWESEESPAHVLEEMASRSDAETWVLDDETLSRAVGQVRDWAEHEYSDLSTSQVIERRFVLSVSRKER